MKKLIQLLLLLLLSIFGVVFTQAQTPFKGSCLSGNCKNGEGSYRIAENVVYRGGFTNGLPSGQARIEGPNWYVTGTFEGEMLTSYEERLTGAGSPNGGLDRSGSQKLVLFDYNHVKANFMTDNFYEMNGKYFQCVCSGTCTFYRGAEWSITGEFNTENPYRVMGKAVVKWQGTDYQFNFPGSGEWVLVVKKDRILECLKAQNYSTGVLYDYSNPGAPVGKVTPVITSSSGKSLTDMVADMDAVKAADKLVRAQALQTAIQEDFCTTLNRVISELNNGFETWKGPEQKHYFGFGKSWYSRYMVEGSVYASISERLENRLLTGSDGKAKNLNSWHCVFFEGGSSFSKAMSVYQDYVSKMNACTQSCCTFTSNTESKRDLGSTGQSTIWTVTTVQPGSNVKYKDMKISIRFSLNALDDIWLIDMWVE